MATVKIVLDDNVDAPMVYGELNSSTLPRKGESFIFNIDNGTQVTATVADVIWEVRNRNIVEIIVYTERHR